MDAPAGSAALGDGLVDEAGSTSAGAPPTSTLRPGRVRPWHSPMPWFKRADLDGVATMIAQNLATMLLGAQMLHGTFSKSGAAVANEIVYNQVLPAMGLALFAGGVFYALQAQVASHMSGRTDFCSQPFGISTPGVFVFVASIVVPVYANTGDAKLTWQIACLANLVQGLMEILCSALGPYILKCVSMGALLIALANIGFSFLLIEPLQTSIAFPVVGLLPLIILLLALLADIKLPRLPACVAPVVAASAIAWGTGHLTAAGVAADASALGVHLPRFALRDVKQIRQAFHYISIIVPISLTSSVGSLMCQQLAASAGDEYSVRVTMLGDGVVTTLAALCGCPFGFTVYVGHPALKQMGCQVGYNLLTGAVVLVLCCTGIAAIFLTIVPIEALNSFVVFVGIILCADALRVIPDRHWPAFVVGLVPGVCNWCVSQANSFASAVWPANVPMPNFAEPSAWENTKSGLYGLYALSNGYILTATCWCSILMSLVDRQFASAGAWCITSAFLSLLGLIHSPDLSVPWQLGIDSPQMQLAFAYVSCGLLFFVCRAGQTLGWIHEGLREDDPSVSFGANENESFVQVLERRYENKLISRPGFFARTF